jgi:hypothetical protein
MTVTDERPTETMTRQRPSYVRMFAVVGLAVAFLVAITGSALALNAHVHNVYNKKDDAYRALAIRTDTNKKKAATAARVAQANAVAAAVKKQKDHDVRVLRRAVRKIKSAARRKVDVAYKKGQEQGYSSGTAAGYSSGRSDGVDEGLREGSDSLTCSDDPDVTWLPFCF